MLLYIFFSSCSSISLQETRNCLAFYLAITIPVEQLPFSLFVLISQGNEYDTVTRQLVIVSISATLQEQYHYR